MNVLIACEYSGRVRDAFIAKGHNAWSCDLLPTETEGPHYQGDVRNILGNQWDLLIAHPECTYLCNSGVRWLYNEDGSRNGERWGNLAQAAEFYKLLRNAAHIPKRAIENPTMHRYARELTGCFSPFALQPWEHGHKEMKRTCLELFGLPELRPSNRVGPPPTDPKERTKWAVVHRMSPGPNRWKERSRTYEGVALAMAEQWG
jgi:hypothetical protein